MRGSGSNTGASAYGTTSRTPRASSRPPPSRATSSNVIDVDAIEPPARTTSTGRCLSVASAPTRPNRPLHPFEPPHYSQSAYAGSSKGKGGPSKGGKGAPGWVDSSWTSRPNTWTSRSSREDPSTGEPKVEDDWVDQSWHSNAPKTQASTRTNQSDSYYQDADSYYHDDDYNYDAEPWPLESDDEAEYPYEPARSTAPLSYDSVPVPESKWQPYNMPQYNHEIETIDELRHLGTFGLKPPYRFGTHEDDPMKTEYTKLEPSVLTIASSTMAGLRKPHTFLSEKHYEVLWNANAAIVELGKTICIDSWGRTAPFPYELARSAPDTSFDEHGNLGGKPGYQWYTKIEVACQNFRTALMKWRHYDEELDYGFRQDLTEHTLPSQIARLNRMHREISGIDDLINVADGIDLIFKYRRFWTQERMRREAPVAVSIMGVIRDLQKVCQANDWLFEDRAPFLAYKVDLLLRRHQLRGLRGTSRLGYKRYGCAPHRTQDLAVQLQEYFRLGEQIEPYAYNAVALGAPIDLVQLATIYQTGPGRLGYHDFDRAIRRVAALHSSNEEYVNLFPFVDAPDLVRRLGTSTYLMSPFEAGYQDGQRWRRTVKFRRDVYADKREEIEKTDSPASDPFHPDPLDHRFLSMESNAYQHHFDIPFFKYLTPIHDDFKAAHRRKVSCRDQVLEAVIVDTASSLVTAEAVRFALQSSLADGHYVHQHLRRLQEEGSRTDTLEIVDRYALGPEKDDISAVIVVRRLSIADTPWWRVDTRTGQFYHSMAAGTGSKETYRWSTGRHDGYSFEVTNRADLWSEDVWKPSSLWDFYSTRAQSLGPGQFRALAREHVFVFQYKCPVDDRPGDPNLRLLNHRSGILIQKRALDSDIRRHYTGHDTFKFMAGVETLKEVHELCRLPVDRSYTFTWGRDC